MEEIYYLIGFIMMTFYLNDYKFKFDSFCDAFLVLFGGIFWPIVLFWMIFGGLSQA